MSREPKNTVWVHGTPEIRYAHRGNAGNPPQTDQLLHRPCHRRKAFSHRKPFKLATAASPPLALLGSTEPSMFTFGASYRRLQPTYHGLGLCAGACALQPSGCEESRATVATEGWKRAQPALHRRSAARTSAAIAASQCLSISAEDHARRSRTLWWCS